MCLEVRVMVNDKLNSGEKSKQYEGKKGGNSGKIGQIGEMKGVQVSSNEKVSSNI